MPFQLGETFISDRHLKLAGHLSVWQSRYRKAGLPLIPGGEEDWRTYGAIDSTESMVIKFDPLEITDEQAARLQEGKMDIFIDGVCRYMDSMGGKSYYTYGFTLNLKRKITPRYERHHRIKAQPS